MIIASNYTVHKNVVEAEREGNNMVSV